MNEPQLYEVVSKNNSVAECPISIGVFSTKDKAIDYINKEFIRITPQSVTELLPIEGFNCYERFDYISHYGSYNCSYLIKPIYIDPKHYLDQI